MTKNWQQHLTRSAIVLTLLSSNLPALSFQKSSGLPTLTRHSNLALANTSGGRVKGGSFDDNPTLDNSSPYDNRDRNNSSGDQEPMGFFGFLILLVLLGMMYRSGALNEILKTSGLTEGASANTPPVKNNLQTVASGIGETTTYTLQSPQPVRRKPTYRRSTRSSRTAAKRFSDELTNNTVTITQLQVGMLASARHMQRALNQIATETDVSTKKGLTKSLRETVLALLRSPDTWSHVSAKSQKLRSRQAAKESFESLSLEERSKFAAETLSNEDGSVRLQTGQDTPSHELADYIVVTLILGTAHDKPFIKNVNSPDTLRTALKTIGSITPEYLMVYEVLWSPQDENDSLTDDELLLHYPQMLSLG